MKRKVYEETKNPEKPEQERSHLGAIATIGAGPYTGFHDGGKYGSFFQPNLGFEFLAEPQGSLHFLLGGHIGFVNAFTTGISFGLTYGVALVALKVFLPEEMLLIDRQLERLGLPLSIRFLSVSPRRASGI